MVWDRIALLLVIIGALNWGAVGLFGFDLVAFICGGQMAVLERFAVPRRDYFTWNAPCGGGYLLETDESKAGQSGWLRLLDTVCYTRSSGKGGAEC